jgi:hypothetical protein
MRGERGERILPRRVPARSKESGSPARECPLRQKSAPKMGHRIEVVDDARFCRNQFFPFASLFYFLGL